VAKAAAASGASMNEWVIEALREKVGEDLDTA
jgi:predicted HicB family RNase H-like nuclease